MINLVHEFILPILLLGFILWGLYKEFTKPHAEKSTCFIFHNYPKWSEKFPHEYLNGKTKLKEKADIQFRTCRNCNKYQWRFV